MAMPGRGSIQDGSRASTELQRQKAARIFRDMESARQRTGMKKVEIELSPQAVRLLTQLASYGILGQTKEEVAARFVDRVLIELLGNPHLNLKLKRR